MVTQVIATLHPARNVCPNDDLLLGHRLRLISQLLLNVADFLYSVIFHLPLDDTTLVTSQISV